MKPFHVSVVEALGKLEIGDWERACSLLDLIAATKVPAGEEANLVKAAIDAAICVEDDRDVNKSAVAVIVAYDGRTILQERLSGAEAGSNEADTILSLIEKFNKQEGIEPIEISEGEGPTMSMEEALHIVGEGE